MTIPSRLGFISFGLSRGFCLNLLAAPVISSFCIIFGATEISLDCMRKVTKNHPSPVRHLCYYVSPVIKNEAKENLLDIKAAGRTNKRSFIAPDFLGL